MSYNNLGTVFYNRKEYTKAMEYYQKALHIFEQVLGIDHPNTANLLFNIGMTFYIQGDYAKSLECLKKALAIRERVLGPEHPSVVMLYASIGKVYLKVGDKKSAQIYLDRIKE
jgi:tetratricopeptide (TPR) repeat protein